jgi:hypothetical protein
MAAPETEQIDRHARALQRFKLAAQAEDPQRQREVDDLKFIDFDDQWPADVMQARSGISSTGNGLPAVPARPCLTINKLLQPVEIVATQARQARLALSFSPKSNGADQDTAEAFEDIVRAIQANSRAHLARQWAFERAVKAGRGFYRILTEYANDGDNDLDIVYKRILNQSSVYLDPSAQEPDWSDGLWAFVTEDLPLERYKAQYPKSQMATDPGVLEGIGNSQPAWVREDESGQLIRVAEYWEVVLTKVSVTLYAFPDRTEKNLTADEEAFALKSGGQPVINEADGQPFVREVERRKVRWTKINAVETLASQDWPGRYIPIIPVIGREANVNGERRWGGIVRPSRGAQQYYNFQVSNQAETIATATRAPYIAYWETIEPYADWWKQSAVRNFPFLPVAAARDAQGNVLPLPQRNVAEPAIQAITMAIAQANSDIQATTTVHDPSLGNLSPNERSGKAIMALQKQSEQSTGQYLDNLAQMSILYEGKVLRDLIPKVYTRVGRIVPAVGADEQQRQIMLGQAFVTKDGQPQPAQQGDPKAKVIDLAKGEYGVAVTVGKSYTTRREEGVAQMGALAEAAPNMVPVYADLWVGNMDFPGARQIADRLKKTNPAAQDTEEGQPSPEQLQQQLQQASQMMELMGKELDAKNKVIETDQIKAQASLQETQLKEQADTEREQLRLQAEMMRTERDNATKIQIAEMQANTQFGVAELKVGLDTAKMRLAHIEELMGHQAEARQIESEQAHDAQQMDANRQAEAAAGDADRSLKRAEGEDSRQLQREEGAEGRAFEADQAERARKAEAAKPEAIA